MNTIYVLAINPGSTSTKIALYDALVEVIRAEQRYSLEQLNQFKTIYDQLSFRLEFIKEFLKEHSGIKENIRAVVGRGGLLRPMAGGCYVVNQKMVEDLKRGVQGQHASNLGGLMAKAIADEMGIAAFIVDPVAVDELAEVARLSGIPQIQRRSLVHALNIKAVSHRLAEDLEVAYADLNLIVAHLGGGISIAAIKNGRIIDVNNANEMGPFSPERSGGLPSGDIVTWCFSGAYASAGELKKVITRGSGITAYLGTNNLKLVEESINLGDQTAKVVWEAMCYQISKEIGQMATVLQGQVDAIILTGGLAYSESLTQYVTSHVSFLAQVFIYPGEDELQALAEGAVRVLKGEEEIKIY